MHFSIPDTLDINNEDGSTFKGYNIHINGVFHCTVRFKQLHNLHEQLRKEFGSAVLPQFPPKKLLPLTSGQLEERRILLEKYIQSIGQDSQLVTSDLLKGFLLSAQHETNCEKSQEMRFDIYLMNGTKIPLSVLTTDRSDQVLTKACKQINLPAEYVNYFSLFLIKKEENNADIVILRKLQDFESPYISYKSIQDTNRVVIRKSYWDPDYDIELMSNTVALNLLYAQTVSDIERGWILCSKETQLQLTSSQSRGAKRDYLDLARTLKYYGFLQFKPCICDYPKPQSVVCVSIGNQELNMRLKLKSERDIREGSFKVTRMKCWRITALHNSNKQNSAIKSNNKNINTALELSFEYLMYKDKLQWITIASDQAILMSVCLQSMVDELLLKRNGSRKKSSTRTNKSNYVYMKRDGSSQLIAQTVSDEEEPESISKNGENSSQSEKFSIRNLQKKFSSVSFKSEREFVENHAFEGIGDDDL